MRLWMWIENLGDFVGLEMLLSFDQTPNELSELSGEGTVLKACEHVSSHAELDELDLKVLKTLQLLLDHIVNIVCVYC